jgi:cell division protein FtsQ
MAKRQQDETSRAEKIRARRQQSSDQAPKVPMGSSATRKPKEQRAPVTRRPLSPTPVVTRKKHMAYVPLKKKGAELQVPALPRLQIGWRLISGSIFLLSLAVVISFTSLSAFQISTITLRGAQRLSTEAILSQVDLTGSSIITVEPDHVQTMVEDRFPSLSNVSVSVSLPASVTLRVVEREPVILWQQDNLAHWIDAEGVMFPVFGEAAVAQTVAASGNPPAAPEVFNPEVDEETGEISHVLEPSLPSTTPEFVQAVLSLSNYIPEGTTLQYDPQFGLGWRDPIGWLVYFGRDTHNIDMKLSEYQTIIGALEKQNITPALISLEFLHAPYYRLEQ